MASPLAREHALIWGSPAGGTFAGRTRLELCRQYIDRGVSGVFFAPLELSPAKSNDVNERIARALDEASIPSCCSIAPSSPTPAAVITISSASTTAVPATSSPSTCCGWARGRIAFVAMPHAAATVDAREAGYRERSVRVATSPVDRSLVHRLDPSDSVSGAVDHGRRNGRTRFVCANDRTASRLMPTLLRLGYAIPADVRVVGIDDLEYAKLLPVPLDDPAAADPAARGCGHSRRCSSESRARTSPTRDILLDCELIVRESCGGKDHQQDQRQRRCLLCDRCRLGGISHARLHPPAVRCRVDDSGG